MSSVEKVPAPATHQLPAPPAATVAVAGVLEITPLAPAVRVAPLAWREVAGNTEHGGDLSGLQWLEEPEAHATTLQRLARARRLAA